MLNKSKNLQRPHFAQKVKSPSQRKRFLKRNKISNKILNNKEKIKTK